MAEAGLAPWFFVHVPKTAGTSLTQAARQQLGTERCEFDYGPGNPNTTQRVRELAHEAQDLFRLRHRLHKDKVALLGGHVPLSQYASLFPSTQIVSFIRDPLAQVLSHHAHISRESGSMPLADFILRPQGAGVQARMLSAAPIAALGPIGITERFEDSLRVINASLGLDLRPAQLNLNPMRTALAEPLYKAPAELSGQLDALLREEHSLYARAHQLLDERLRLLDAGLPFANGGLTEVSEQGVRGFAFWATQPQAVSVVVLVNNEEVATLRATRFHARWRGLNTPREGCVGFDHRLTEPLQDGDLLQVRVARTGQLLGSHRLI